MLGLSSTSGQLWHVCAGSAGSIAGVGWGLHLRPMPAYLAASHCGHSCPCRQTNHTGSSWANTRLLV